VSRHEWKYVADIVTELDQNLPLIPLRIDEMNQVILNLLVNASHAISDALKQRGAEKGIITVRTKYVDRHVVVEIQDNGTGIPESAQAHIFRALFLRRKRSAREPAKGWLLSAPLLSKTILARSPLRRRPARARHFTIRLPMPETAQV